MEITWRGHSCFVIKSKEKTLITDPCPPDIGYQLHELKADIVTISHFHHGHNYVTAIADSPKIIKGPGEYEIGGIFITGIGTFHDNKRGELRGKNTIYTIEIDGLTLCHLGDLGHRLSPQLIQDVGNVDILFLPVGEVSTISLDIALELVGQLEPRLIIPMHYKTPAFSGNLCTLDRFLNRMRIREFEARPKLSVTSSTLPASAQVTVLSYT
jgi:L-ascorbate metabolism protein UlaG (beta-lactamase superfamily)